MASEVEHVFIYLFAMYMSSWDKCVFRPSALLMLPVGMFVVVE